MKNSNIKFFDNYKTRSVGIWYFVPSDKESYRKNNPCYGFGAIKYLEGSVYTGELFYDGKYYNKIGYGQQDFSNSGLGDVDPIINERKYMYVGQFDYRKTDWIYGNGVLYYKDLDGKPSRFIKGFFSGLDLIKPYTKEFDYSSLLEGYTKEMESDYNPRRALFNEEMKNHNHVEDLETLFVGDSYFEFWYYEKYAGKVFKDCYDLKHNLNVGLGGSKFVDWYEYIPLLKDIKKPKNIVVNLGFNDLHASFSPLKVYRDFKKFLKMFREIFPDANYYLLDVVHGPGFVPFYERENCLNKMMFDMSKKNKITIIRNAEQIENTQKTINCFDEDGCHLNPTGYNIILKNINAAIK